MAVNLSIKNVPDALADKLRARAERNHRSLQGELMAILEAAMDAPHQVTRANSPGPAYDAMTASALADTLLERLVQIAGERGIDTSRHPSREEARDRETLQKHGV